MARSPATAVAGNVAAGYFLRFCGLSVVSTAAGCVSSLSFVHTYHGRVSRDLRDGIIDHQLVVCVDNCPVFAGVHGLVV